MTFDAYAVAVPFYDLWHDDGHVPDVREKLPPLVSGSVLEIGAGTGTGENTVIGEDVVESATHRPSAATLRAELTEAGFVREEAPEGLLSWRLAK
ncbi:hypothetical protein ACFXJ8_09310 [Nonomuraea sp. NPDC059194]|uniref:hypothetical protein n=1 Tax=Nonomuraea sp. NPDC059194 TaxID=3346764 RepID=UPI003698009A